jgi:ABC-type multidrug transport system ATPase subunit
MFLARQYICIYLMFTATASVDFENDQAIQRMLRTSPAFKQATLIVIAHRIDTIIDSDLVMVMDSGNLAEIGTPQDLCSRHGGIFASMVEASKKSKGGGGGGSVNSDALSVSINPLVTAPAPTPLDKDRTSSSSSSPSSLSPSRRRGLLDGDEPPPPALPAHAAIKTMVHSQGRLGTSLDGF